MKLRIVKPKVNEHPNWIDDEMDVYDGMVIESDILLSNKSGKNIVRIDGWEFNLKWFKPVKCIQL